LKSLQYISFRKLLAWLLLVALPLALFVWQGFEFVQQAVAVIRQQTTSLTLYFASGVAAAMVLYTFRLRLLPTAAVLAAVLLSMYAAIDRSAIGEFDTFYLSVQFLIFAYLFFTGWLSGWGLLRWRWYPWVFSGVVLLVTLLWLPVEVKPSLAAVLIPIGSVLAFSAYLIYICHALRNLEDNDIAQWKRLVPKVILFTLLAGGLVALVAWWQSPELDKAIEEARGGGKEGEQNMLGRNKDGTYNVKKGMQLGGSNGRGKELLFVAHIENYFEGTDIPNPLYLTSYHFTRFDTTTETFEPDPNVPQQDLFRPNPSAIPLYATVQDSSVLKTVLHDKLQQTVEIEIYNRKLGRDEFTAPITSFFVQPVTVEKEMRKEFVSAFRAKSLSSKLNSAYFVYNPGKDPMVKAFQEMRFEELRKVKDFDGLEPQFKNYYTFMPKGGTYDSITALTRRITAGAQTPVDQVIAIRDYFMSKDKDGEPLFKYSDNPGIPGVPAANKLMYFLFENRKGYCAYFAGATLFMLRSLGIPSRMTVGFLVVDRSDKNKGWYWVYADQTHAWVQVYFPGYGWIDFDTTIGNDDAREAPQPDGTPPLQPSKAWLAVRGKVLSVDTLQRMLNLDMKSLMFKDKDYIAATQKKVQLDLRSAKVVIDSAEMPISKLTPQMNIIGVSFAEVYKNKKLSPQLSDAVKATEELGEPFIIDEVYVQPDAKQEPPAEQPKEAAGQGLTGKDLLWYGLYTLAGIIAILLLLPMALQAYYLMRSKMAGSDALRLYYLNKAVTHRLFLLGFYRGDTSAMRFAADTDRKLGIGYERLQQAYQQLKYSDEPLSSEQQAFTGSYWKQFRSRLQQNISFNRRGASAVNGIRTLQYLMHS